MYLILWNTGDYYWDNFPIEMTCNSIEEVMEEIDLTEENIKELEETDYTCDEECIIYEVRKIKNIDK